MSEDATFAVPEKMLKFVCVCVCVCVCVSTQRIVPATEHNTTFCSP